jgi:hypothetical protein
MDIDDKDQQILELEERINCLEAELHDTKVHLKKYTAPESHKVYYNQNREKLLQNMKLNPISQEKRKEYNRTSYLRRKSKLEINQKENTGDV